MASLREAIAPVGMTDLFGGCVSSRLQGCVVFWGVYVQNYEWVVDGDGFDEFVVGAADFAGVGGDGGAEERFYHFTGCDDGVAVLALVFGDYGPLALVDGLVECGPEGLQGCGLDWGTINQRDYGGVAASA
jgi:hypothetical protein